MRSWKPAEHHETANVAPLEQFFELAHIGDTIQSMVQVYFDKELVRGASSSLAQQISFPGRPLILTGRIS